MSDGMAYVGRETCGCVVAAVVDDPAHRRDVAKETGKWLRSGMTLERVTVEAVRKMDWNCPHRAERRKARAAAKAGR